MALTWMRGGLMTKKRNRIKKEKKSSFENRLNARQEKLSGFYHAEARS